MRQTILAALVALTGCFTPVAPPAAGDPDGSVVLRCGADSDCPQSAAGSCAPFKTTCRQGACVAESLPTVWENDPGACRTAEDCSCQPLTRPGCGSSAPGAFDCLGDRCVWSCQTTDCTSDRDCPEGRVCELAPPDCLGSGSCVSGCHANEDCAEGELCDVAEDCFTCPCPGRCQAAPGCSTDADCPWQTVCEPTPEHPEPHCIPGCRDDDGCTAGDACRAPEACPSCLDCPCVGSCEPRNGCSSDAECERGRICAQDSDCSQKCVPGCRIAADCESGESCAPPPPCEACGCDHGSCVAGQTGCASDRECGPEEVCEPISPECSGERGCVAGCREDADCGEGASCLQPDCDGCPCPGFCVALPGCSADAQCGPGMICQGCPELGLDPICVPGCTDDASCGQGESCQPVFCDGCFCPLGLCMPAMERCESDQDCPLGSVCELGPDCEEPKQCISGCHQDLQCGPGGRCLQTPCATCPCAGVCEETANCTDADRDGWVVDCEAGGACPNVRGYCDCDDRDPRVHPGAAERCDDGQDQDCDGEVDEGCGCAMGSCTSPMDCAAGSESCVKGCCSRCELSPPPLCLPGECSFAGGIADDGCLLPNRCAACCSCPAVSDPVCGTNYATYPSPCEAACAGVEVLHRGACAAGEGLSCGYPDSALERCAQGQYCRDECPMCGALRTRCTKVGACAEDYDCPAGLNPPGCSAGPGRWECLEQTCFFHCP